jgi:hypothetical protein
LTASAAYGQGTEPVSIGKSREPVGPPRASKNPLPGDPRALLAKLNTYRAVGTDTAGYCHAVGVFATMLIGYGTMASRRRPGTSRPPTCRA